MAGAYDSVPWNNISSTPATFVLTGGAYGITLHATAWGTATLQRLAPDNSTFITVVSAIGADGYQNVNLPAGTYKLLLAGVTGLIGDITSIVTGVS